MKRPRTLTASFVKRVGEPGIFGDGRGSRGLQLRVHRQRNGRISKSWRQRIRIDGRYTCIGLGPYPEVTLAEARDACRQNSRKVRHGIDPRGPRVPKFADAYEAVIALKRPAWRGPGTEQAWRSTLASYIGPAIGGKRMNAITPADVLAVLKDIWHSKPALAKQCRQRMSATFAWAIAKGFTTTNPADDASGALPPQAHRTTHHRPVSNLGALLRHIGTDTITAQALAFLAHTAARCTEVLGATWSEIDGDMWRIPEDRYKTAKSHSIPLCSRARAILAMRPTGEPDERIFPRTVVTLRRLLRKHTQDGDLHGLRGNFRNWAAENGIDRHLAESALGHTVGGTEGAYLSSVRLVERREVMERWCEHLAAD